MHLTISLVNPPTAIRGWLRNSFLEPQANLFVGVANTIQINDLIENLEQSACIGLVIVHTKESSLGVRIKTIGEVASRFVATVDGIQVVKRIKNQ